MSTPTRTESPFLARSPTFHRTRSSSSTTRRQTLSSRIYRTVNDARKRGERLYAGLTPLQRAGAITVGVLTIILSILGLVFNEQIFHYMADFAKSWRSIRGGFMILWIMTFIVSFPPLLGYSSCVTLAGFVYGFPNGWFIVSTATICGSTVAFILSRHLLHSYVARLIANDSRFAALALVLKHDGLKLLIMIRLCPLPYSLSNGALSTIPTVTWRSFALATAVVSPKLLLHVFIGAQWAKLADNGDKMDAKTKALSYLSIAIGMFFGLATGYIIYGQTKKRAQELEELERTEAGALRSEYEDDPDLAEAAEWLREEEDDISLRDAWADSDEYRDTSGSGSVSPPEEEDMTPLTNR